MPTATTPYPGSSVRAVDLIKNGTITTQNLVPAGSATAGSAVELQVGDGACSLSVQVTGTYTGALSLQGSVNGTDWITVGGTVFFNVNSGAASATIASAAVGIFQTECSGYSYVRITGLAAVTGTANVWIRASKTTSIVAIDSALPASPVTQSGTWNVGTASPTASFINSAASTNATSVKSSAGTVWSIYASNVNAAVRYLKFYNKASAPTVGTDVPVLVLPIPATGAVQYSPTTNGVRFSTGIALALTTGMADSDTTAVAANEIKISTQYT